jgi:hypothetical protein
MDAANTDDRRDPMGPPAEPCECFCLHCRRVFMSDTMWFQRVINARDGFEGFWLCPTPNCGGAGFTMDIFPTDPDHPANSGWHSDDEEEEGEIDGEEDGEEEEWDPAESKFEEFDDEEGDIEGEEWKLGIRPDELPVVPVELTEKQRQAQIEMEREREEEEKRYDMPDERPRVLDWANREDPPPMGEDAIPF